MKPRLTTVLLACLSFTFVFSFPAAAVEQPRMRRAIDLLQEAKRASDPVPLLEQALQSVQDARKNKGGRRVHAMDAIRAAIKIAKERGNPEPKINHAIAMIHSGMGRAE